MTDYDTDEGRDCPASLHATRAFYRAVGGWLAFVIVCACAAALVAGMEV